MSLDSLWLTVVNGLAFVGMGFVVSSMPGVTGCAGLVTLSRNVFRDLVASSGRDGAVSAYDEVISAANANIQALEQAKAAIESTKAKVDQAQQQAASLGAEALAGRTAGLKDPCEQAQGQIEAAKQKMQEVINQANGLKG